MSATDSNQWPRSRSTHGHTANGQQSATYTAWRNMISRCRSTRTMNSNRYLGRGITFDPRWESFESFLADMGECPRGLTLDRIDNDGNYEPSNCRWATTAQQARNKSQTVLIAFRGETMCRKDWATRLGISNNTLKYRLERWPFELAMTTPFVPREERTPCRRPHRT